MSHPDPMKTRTFLMRFAGEGALELQQGNGRAQVAGEAILTFNPDVDNTVRVERLGLAVGSLEFAGGRTGRFNIGDRDLFGTVTEGFFTRRRLRAGGVNESGEVRYPWLTTKRTNLFDPSALATEEAGPAALSASARSRSLVEGWLRRRDTDWVLEEGRVEVAWRIGLFGKQQHISLDFEEVELRPLPDRPPLISECGVPFFFRKRRLTFQPFGFGTSEADATGHSATNQFTKASEIWAKACVDIVALKHKVIPKSDLRSSSDLRMLVELVEDDLPLGVIPVFFVANPLEGDDGGGRMLYPEYSGVMVAEPNQGNPVLLAHELGHVLNLPNAGQGAQSDDASVMKPSGAATKPGKELVSFLMCTCVSHNWMETLDQEPCSFTHDMGDHFIAHYAGDEGLGPTPMPAVAFLTPDLWTTPSETTRSSDDHRLPRRFSAGGSAAETFVAVRVQQRSEILTRRTVVRFFWRLPGSGGGYTALTPIGETQVKKLSKRSPSIATARWTLAAGVPHHSAVFALVRSDAEPEGELDKLSWAEFETLVRDDNDWAVRNLEVQEFVPAAAMETRLLESAPFIVRLPPNTTNLTLEVNASAAAGLLNLELEVLGLGLYPLWPGTTSIGVELQGTGEIMVVLRAGAPAGIDPDSTFTLLVEPRVDGQEMIGFACRFRAAATEDVVSAVLDAAMAALSDLRDLAGVSSAGDLLAVVWPLLSSPPALRALVELLTRSPGPTGLDLSRLAAEPVMREPEMQSAAPAQAFARWTEVLEGFMAGDRTPEAVVQAVGDLARRLITATALYAQKKQ